MYQILVVLIAAIVARGYGDDSVCPEAGEISPCTCFKAKDSQRVTALCKNFTTASDVSDIFNKNPNWNLQDVHVDECTMSYIPATMLEQARFQSLNVSNSVLDTLFDVAPKRTPELNLYLYKLRLMRGFEWNLFSNSSLKDFGAFETEIHSFGSAFKDSMPHDVERIWFEGTKTRRITSQAFKNLKVLQILAIRNALLKTLSRDMFPKPWNSIVYLDFSFNKIMSLPENIFVDMPKMAMFIFQRNLLTTLSEKTFLKNGLYGFIDNPFNCNCNMKWVTTTKIIDHSLIKGKCDKPDGLKGRDLEKLTTKDFSYCT